MTIRKKIIVGFSTILIIGLILGICGLVSTNMLTKLSDEQYALQSASTGAASVLNAHYVWRQGLTEAVLAGAEFTGSLDPNACALGKWKNSEEALNITDTEILTLLKQIDDPHAFIHNEAKSILTMLETEDLNGAEQDLLESVLPRTGEVITILTAMQTRYTKLLEMNGIEITSTGNMVTTIIIVLLVLAVVLSFILALLITKSIMQPLRKITSAAETIATGNLDVQMSYHVNDQIGSLVKSFQGLVDDTKKQASIAEALADGDLTVKIEPRSEKDVMSFALIRMIDSLDNMFGEIQGSAAQVSTGSRQIADGAQSLAQGSTEQVSSIEELSASISEVADKTRHNADIAREAADLSGSIKSNAEKGSLQMEQMMQAVREINEASGQIEKVIKVIDDIAFQTNILALNAAVEAARAGQHGKGFAVVAQEVRNLAAKSAEAAKDTGGLIENSIEKSNLGLNIATETASSLKEIVEGIDHSAEIVARIARSSDEQAVAIVEINTNIAQVAQIVQQNSATAEESAAASEQMSGQSDMLSQLISQFKLKNTVYRPSLLPESDPHRKVLAVPGKTAFALSDNNEKSIFERSL